jgi:hypothetical protein
MKQAPLSESGLKLKAIRKNKCWIQNPDNKKPKKVYTLGKEIADFYAAKEKAEALKRAQINDAVFNG